MMSYLNQAKHNTELLETIREKSPNLFHDWEVTIIFYTARHYLNAFLKVKKQSIPKSHVKFDELIHPVKGKPKVRLTQDIYDAFNDIKYNSRNTRYNGEFSSDFQKALLHSMVIECDKNLKVIVDFLKRKSVV